MNTPTLYRFSALTGLRALAAIMVFVYHNRKVWVGFLPEPFIRLLNEFHTGVSVFFVLSGFLIAYTYGDEPARSGKAYRQYIFVRMARIFPIYLVLLSIKYIDLGFPGRLETGLTYTLTQGLFDNYSLSGIPQSWSLTTELCFYVLAPFIVMIAIKNIYRAFLLLLGMLATCLLLGWGLHAAGLNPHNFLYNPMFVCNTVFFGRFAEFFAGILLALFIRNSLRLPRFMQWRHQTLWGGLGMIAIIVIIALFQENVWKHGIENWGGLLVRNLLFPVATMVFIHGLIKEKTWVQWLLGNKIAVLLGNASFIFYLVHINYVNNQIWKWHHFPDRNFILLWVVSIVLYWLIEKPAYHFFKRLIRKPVPTSS